jgi:aspartate aminotransferase
VPSQWAAAVALADDRVATELDRLMEELTERRAQVVAFFRDRLPGVEFVEPLGAQFLFFRVDGFFDGEITNAVELCERLLVEQGVALAPGQAFGDERWVRLSYGVPGRLLREALERFAGFTATLARRETQ